MKQVAFKPAFKDLLNTHHGMEKEGFEDLLGFEEIQDAVMFGYFGSKQMFF